MEDKKGNTAHHNFEELDSVDLYECGMWYDGYWIFKMMGDHCILISEHDGKSEYKRGDYEYIRPLSTPIDKVREILNKYLPTATIATAIYNELKPYIKL